MIIADGCDFFLCCIQDEGTFHLKDAAKNLLKGLGSQVASTLSWRDMWTLVVKKGGKDEPFITHKQAIQCCGFYHCFSSSLLAMCIIGSKCLGSITKTCDKKWVGKLLALSINVTHTISTFLIFSKHSMLGALHMLLFEA